MKNKIPLNIRKIAFLLRCLFQIRYQIIVKNAHLFNSQAPTLFLPNHPSLLEPLITVLWGIKYKCFVSPVVTEHYFKQPLFRFFLNQIEAVSVSDLEKKRHDNSVLNIIVTHANNIFKQGKNILLYPSGQLSDSPKEHIGNKQSAYSLIKNMPDNVRIVAIRNSGFWNTNWSKKNTGKTPNFLSVFFNEGLFVVLHGLFFFKRHILKLELIDITQEAKLKANTLSRRAFNQYLEEVLSEELK